MKNLLTQRFLTRPKGEDYIRREKEGNRLVFMAIIPAAILIFGMIYLIKKYGFSFADYPLLRQILIVLTSRR